jgi:nitric oxide synthase-interacting protein
MPTRHSKHSGDRGFYTFSELHSSDRFGGSRTERISGDSQLPFGYCPLSLVPIEEAVVSPSGRMYSREAILDYLVQKMQDIKRMTAAYEKQQVSCNHS